MLGRGKPGVGLQQRGRLGMRGLHERSIARHVHEAQHGSAVLQGAEHVALAARLQIQARQLEAVVGRAQRVQTRGQLLVVFARVCDEEKTPRRAPPPHAAAQLVQLG